MKTIIKNQKFKQSIMFLSIFLLFNSGLFALDKQDEIKQIFDEAWKLESNMHKDVSGLDRAIILLEKAIKLDPNNKDVYWKTAEIYFKKAGEEKNNEISLDLHNKALKYSEKALEINPDSLEANYWIGTCSAKLAELAGALKAIGLVKRAKTHLHKCIDIDPNHRFSILARAILAAIYNEAPWPIGSSRKALKLGKEAAKLDPNLTLACVNLAKVYISNKEYKKAGNELERCLSIKQPKYVWDAELYDWPNAKKLIQELKNK